MTFHHVELWVGDFVAAEPRWAWLLAELGWPRLDVWRGGASWGEPTTGYLVIEQSPDVRDVPHDRMRPGMNHLAVWAPDTDVVDRVWATAPEHGWRTMFEDRHPYAGGEAHYAAFLEDDDAFEVEVVAKGQRDKETS